MMKGMIYIGAMILLREICAAADARDVSFAGGAGMRVYAGEAGCGMGRSVAASWYENLKKRRGDTNGR